MHPPARPRVFVDADVLFAGSAASSAYGASLVVLRLAEITLIDALTSHQVVVEAERNLEAKLPAALPTFRLIVARSLQVVEAPAPADLGPLQGSAPPKHLPVLAAALRAGCPRLVTFDVRPYQPGHPDCTALRPGEFLSRVRDQLARLSSRQENRDQEPPAPTQESA